MEKFNKEEFLQKLRERKAKVEAVKKAEAEKRLEAFKKTEFYQRLMEAKKRASE